MSDLSLVNNLERVDYCGRKLTKEMIFLFLYISTIFMKALQAISFFPYAFFQILKHYMNIFFANICIFHHISSFQNSCFSFVTKMFILELNNQNSFIKKPQHDFHVWF